MTDYGIAFADSWPNPWIVTGQLPLPQSTLTSGRFRANPAPNPSPKSSDQESTPGVQTTLDEQLFDNRAMTKIAISQLAMHLDEAWRRVTFEQLDALLASDHWEEDSAFVKRAPFLTFLRFVIFAGPTRVPSLGVGHSGNTLASWRNDNTQINAEFMANDKAAVSFIQQVGRSKEAIVWHGDVADLRLFLQRNGVLDCIL